MLRSLQIPAYRVYYLTMLGQSAAMVMGQVTGPLLIYRLTGSSVLLGTMSLVISISLIIMSLLGGVIADRIPKKQIVFGSLLGFAAVNLAVAFCLDSGILSRENSGSWWILLVSSFIQGGFMGMMMPALSSIIPEIIKRDLLMNASTLNTLGWNILSLLMPVLTGIIIDKLGFEYAYYAASGLFALGAVSILFIPHTGRMPASGEKIMQEIKNGFVYIRQTSTVLWLLLFTTAFVVLSMPYQQLMPLFTDNILNVGATGMGILMSVSGAGALAGSLILMFLPNTKRGLLLIISGLVSGVALFIFAFSSIWGLSIAVMVFVGLSQTFRNTISSVLLLTHTHASYMGRVMSLLNMQWGLMAFGTFLCGVLAGMISVQWVLGGLVLILIAISVLFLAFSPGMRRLE
jgi:predicted MFS family arabinose efflux permease